MLLLRAISSRITVQPKTTVRVTQESRSAQPFAELSLILKHVLRTEAIFRFNCFNVEDSHDPSVGLEYGELAIPGKMLKTEVFDPIIGT